MRKVTRVITAHRQREGAGFIVRRPLPTQGLELVDPFLLIDELGPITYAPRRSDRCSRSSASWLRDRLVHFEGALEHEDSAGHRGRLDAGDVQWMTAGGGIVHSEMPARELLERGGRVHGFQIWVNLPRRLKMTQPRYQELPSAKIPTAQTADGKARVKIIAGEALGVTAAIETHTPIVFQDWSARGGCGCQRRDPARSPSARVCLRGRRRDRRPRNQRRPTGDPRRGRGRSRCKVVPRPSVTLAGVPHREPVARYGPFVMNTQHELMEAFADYQSGRMGEITRTARVG